MGDVLHVGEFDPGLAQAVLHRAEGEADVVLLSGEPLLLYGSYDLAVGDERGGGVAHGRQPEDVHEASLWSSPDHRRPDVGGLAGGVEKVPSDAARKVRPRQAARHHLSDATRLPEPKSPTTMSPFAAGLTRDEEAIRAAMYQHLLDFLCCPACGRALELTPLNPATPKRGEEIAEGFVHCEREHWFPVVGGIPRLLPDSLNEHWDRVEPLIPPGSPLRRGPGSLVDAAYDRRTRQNFSHEWEHHELGDRTWGMDLDYRVQTYFVEPLRIPKEAFRGKVALDAGCGNGSQSVAYTEFGLEVIALDISTGVERGYQFRNRRAAARPEFVHFVQGDLQSPPIRPGSVDIIHSAGVLHHTPDTERSFHRLCPLLRPGGTFYVWVYSYEPVVTPLVNSIRAVTTRIPPERFAPVANALADVFRVFTWTLNALRIRGYPRWTRREAALALLDIFGAPYAHYHSFPEVVGWFQSEGFTDVWECNRTRRGFGVCGRRPAEDESSGREHADALVGSAGADRPASE